MALKRNGKTISPDDLSAAEYADLQKQIGKDPLLGKLGIAPDREPVAPDYTDSIIAAIRRSESQRKQIGRTRAAAFGGMFPTTGFPSLLGGM